MATEFNQLSQDLAQDMELLRNSVQGTGRGFGQLNRELVEANRKIAKELTGGALKDFAYALYEGKEGFSAYNDAVTKAGQAVSKFAASFGPAGAIVGGVIELIIEFKTRALKDFDKVFTGYQEVSRAGATGAAGMIGFADAAARAGVKLENLGDFTALINRSSEALALFGRTTVGGLDKLSEVSDSITKSGLRREFIAMGFKVNDINEGIVRFAKIQAITGQQNRLNQEQLTRGAVAYIKELDLLTKLTGKNAEIVQAEYEARMKDERLLASRIASEAEEKRLRDAGLVEQADQIKTQRELKERLLSVLPPTLQKDFGALFEGIVTGPEVAKLYQMMPETARYVMEGGRDLGKFAASVRDELGQFVGAGGLGQAQALIGNFGQTFGNYAELVLARERAAQVASEGTIKAAQKGQEVTDTAALAQGALRDEQIKTGVALQKFVRDGLVAATKELKAMAKAAGKLTGAAAEPVSGAEAALVPTAPTPPSGPVKLTAEEEAAFKKFQDAERQAAAQQKRATTLMDRKRFLEEGQRKRQEAEIKASEGAAEIPVPAAPKITAPAPPPGSRLLPKGTAQPQTQVSAAASALTTAGLRLKSEEAVAGGSNTQKLIELAHLVQDKLGAGLKYFSGLNDTYTRDVNSKHALGQALDLVLADASQSATVAAMVRGLPNVSYVQDEYLNPSRGSTGGHIHAEVSAKFGRKISGPINGYEVQAHGNEVIIPLSNGQSIPLDMSPLTRYFDSQIQIMGEMNDRLDDLVNVMQANLGVGRKLLNRTA